MKNLKHTVENMFETLFLNIHVHVTHSFLANQFLLGVVSQRSRIAVDEPPNAFANLRIINAANCPINVFGIGLNAEVPVMEV